MFEFNKKGLTLIELLAVIAIIAILFILLIPSIGSAFEKARISGVQTDFRSYQIAGQGYFTENIGKAKTEDGVNQYLDKPLRFTNGKSKEKNPWGNPYELEPTANGFKIVAKSNTTASLLSGIMYADDVLQYELVLEDVNGKFSYEFKGFDSVVVGDAATTQNNGDGSNTSENQNDTDPLDDNNIINNLDTDGDGLTDKEEVDLGTNPTIKDTDGDGLTDKEEIILGTDPKNKDTDGDGMEDKYEVDRGYDPLDANPFLEVVLPDGYSSANISVSVRLLNTNATMTTKKYASGSKVSSYFTSSGTSIGTTNSVTISSNGIYTFYVKDSNNVVYVKEVDIQKIDKIAPTFTFEEYHTNAIAVVDFVETGSGYSHSYYFYSTSSSKLTGTALQNQKDDPYNTEDEKSVIGSAKNGVAFGIFDGLPSGTYYLHYILYDKAGNFTYNVSSSKSLKLIKK